MRKVFSFLAGGTLLFLLIQGCGPIYVTETPAQPVAVTNVTPPDWAPAYNDVNQVHYYYIPDLQMYYDVWRHDFVYYNNGTWVFSPNLPPQYATYDINDAFVVVLNYDARDPWYRHSYYERTYPRYYYRNNTNFRSYSSYDPGRNMRGFNENARSVMYSRSSGIRPSANDRVRTVNETRPSANEVRRTEPESRRAVAEPRRTISEPSRTEVRRTTPERSVTPTQMNRDNNRNSFQEGAGRRNESNNQNVERNSHSTAQPARETRNGAAAENHSSAQEVHRMDTAHSPSVQHNNTRNTSVKATNVKSNQQSRRGEPQKNENNNRRR